MSIGNRLRNLREDLGLTQEEVGTHIGVTKATVNRYETGEIDIKRTIAIKLAKVLNTTPAYIMGWEDNESHSNASLKKKSIRIPVLGRVQAGIPVDAIEEIIDYEEITEEMAAQGECFGLIIRGQSMMPRMVEGDVIIVRKQSDVDSGNIAVILVNGNDATVKKIRKTESGIELVPLNPSFDIIYYSNYDIEKLPVTIIGKVVELRGKF